MPSIKKSVLPQSKVLFNMKIMLDAVKNYMNCLNMKCNQVMNIYYRNKKIIEMEKLMFDFRNNLKNGNADYKKFNNEIVKLKIKAIKEKEHEEFVKCQLNNCYNDTFHMMKISLENILTHYEKSSKEYKLASKYKKILETNKLTVELYYNIDTELLLTAEYINFIETELTKLQMNMMKINKNINN